MSLSPLLVAEDLRIDVAGVPACDGIAFRSTGSRILVLGAPRVLFDATLGLVRVARGALTIRGQAAAGAAASGLVAGAAMDPPMPPQWTVLEYVEWSARLGGLDRSTSRARADAKEAIDKLQLAELSKTAISGLVPHARRATVIAAALATAAEVLVLDDPTGNLPDETAMPLARVVAAALEGRAWILLAPRMPLTSPLTMAADEAIVVAGARVDAQGVPAELAAAGRRFVGRVDGALSAIAPMLEARGARIEEHGAHVLFDLGADMSTSELMAICDGAGIAIVELVPILRALS